MTAKVALVAVLCLTSTMPLVPVAVADPNPDFCVVDIFQSSTIADCADMMEIRCNVRGLEKVAPANRVWIGDEDEAGSPCRLLSQTTFTSRVGRKDLLGR